MVVQQLIDEVNVSDAQRVLKLNVKETKLMTLEDMPADITIRINNDPVENVRNFKYKYSGSLNLPEGGCCKNLSVWKYRTIPVVNPLDPRYPKHFQQSRS